MVSVLLVLLFFLSMNNFSPNACSPFSLDTSCGCSLHTDPIGKFVRTIHWNAGSACGTERVDGYDYEGVCKQGAKSLVIGWCNMYAFPHSPVSSPVHHPTSPSVHAPYSPVASSYDGISWPVAAPHSPVSSPVHFPTSPSVQAPYSPVAVESLVEVGGPCVYGETYVGSNSCTDIDPNDPDCANSELSTCIGNDSCSGTAACIKNDDHSNGVVNTIGNGR